MPDLSTLFKRYDINASGKIEYEEVQRAIQDWLENRISTEELTQIQRWWLGKDQPPVQLRQQQQSARLQNYIALEDAEGTTVKLLNIGKIKEDWLSGKLSDEEVYSLIKNKPGDVQIAWTFIQYDPLLQAKSVQEVRALREEITAKQKLDEFLLQFGYDFRKAAEIIQQKGFPEWWRPEWTAEYESKKSMQPLPMFLATKAGKEDLYFSQLAAEAGRAKAISITPPGEPEKRVQQTQQTALQVQQTQQKAQVPEMEQWEVEHIKQLVREYGKENAEQMYGKETVRAVLEGAVPIKGSQSAQQTQQKEQEVQQMQQTFSKEEIDRMVRQMVARGIKLWDIQNELQKLGTGTEIVKAEMQSPFRPAEQQTQPQTEQAKEQTPQTAKMDILWDLGKIADSAVKNAIGAVETVTKPITDKITDILWGDVRRRFADTWSLQKLELETKGKKPSLSQLLGAYISPIETASKSFEEKGNAVAAGIAGFAAGALTMITAPVGIAEHIAEKGKEAGLAGVGEAVKNVALGTVEWAVSIPGRVASGSPAEIGKVAGEIMGGAVGGKLMEAPLKVPGRIYGEARFLGKEYVPFEKLAHPDVASGRTEFTPVSVMEKGQFVRQATPAEAVQATIKQFYESPLKESLEIGEKYPAVGGHGSPMAVEMGERRTLEVEQGKPRLWDVPGLYVSGGLMKFFLKVREYTGTLNPIEAVKSAVQTVKEEGVTGFIKEEVRRMFGLPGKEGFIAVGLKGVKEVPAEYARKGLEGYREFFEKGPIEPGFAYIEPKTGILRQTWEHQAVVPKGALLENIHGKGFEAYTKVEAGGKELKVPIYEMAYERVAEWRLPEAVKRAESTEKAPKGEVKPYEQVLKEYGFRERAEYAGPRLVLAPPVTALRPETGEKTVKMPEEIIRTAPGFREPKEAFNLPKESTRVSEMGKTGREVIEPRPKEMLKSPIVEIPETVVLPEMRRPQKSPIIEIPEIIEPRIPKRGREPLFPIPELPEVSEPVTRQPAPPEYITAPSSPAEYISAPAYDYSSILGAIYAPTARGKGIFSGELADITRMVLYAEGRKREEPYRVPGIDLDFFKKFNPVGELLGGRFRL
jgi:hypothetical protein